MLNNFSATEVITTPILFSLIIVSIIILILVLSGGRVSFTTSIKTIIYGGLAVTAATYLHDNLVGKKIEQELEEKNYAINMTGMRNSENYVPIRGSKEDDSVLDEVIDRGR